MHNDQEYGKSIMTSHEIIDRDKGANLKCFKLFNLYAKINFILVFNYCILLILRYTYTKNGYDWSYNVDITYLAAPMKMTPRGVCDE